MILAKLREEPNARELANWLAAYAQDHFGVNAQPAADRDAAEAFLAWWKGVRTSCREDVRRSTDMGACDLR